MPLFEFAQIGQNDLFYVAFGMFLQSVGTLFACASFLH